MCPVVFAQWLWRGRSLLYSCFWEQGAADVIKQMSDRASLDWSEEDLWEEVKLGNFELENTTGPGNKPAWTMLAGHERKHHRLIFLGSTCRPVKRGELTCVYLHIWKCRCSVLFYKWKSKNCCILFSNFCSRVLGTIDFSKRGGCPVSHPAWCKIKQGGILFKLSKISWFVN